VNISNYETKTNEQWWQYNLKLVGIIVFL
jgi:hypothetical protein